MHLDLLSAVPHCSGGSRVSAEVFAALSGLSRKYATPHLAFVPGSTSLVNLSC